MPKHSAGRLLLLSLAAVGLATAQPVFLAEGNYNPYSAVKSPLSAWDGTAFAQAPVLVGYSMQNARAVQSFKTPDGKIYVIAIQPFNGNNVFLFEYVTGLYIPLGQTAVDVNQGIRSAVLSPDCQRFYVLTAPGKLSTVDISDRLNPVVVGPPIQVPGGMKLDVRPQGDRVLVIGANALVYDVNLLTGAVATLNLNLPYFQPQIRYSPDGAFAYFGLEDTARSFVVLNTASFPATLNKVEPGPGGNFGMIDLVFHPTLRRAYFMSWPAGSLASAHLYAIDTVTHTATGFVQTSTSLMAPYQMVMEEDGSKIWMAAARNGFKFLRIPVDAAGTPQLADLEVTIPGLTTAVWGLAVPRTPVGASPLLLPTLAAKSGTQAARVWPLRLRNVGPVAVFGIQVSQVILTQTAGPVCSPVLTAPLPLAYGGIGAGETVSKDLTFNFTGCATTVRFKVEAVVGAGTSSQRKVVANGQSM